MTFPLLAATALSVSSARTTAVSRVEAWLRRDDATMLPTEALAPSVTFMGDLPGASLVGADAYSTAASSWHADCQQLLGPCYETRAIRVALVAPDEVAVRWRAEWSPASTRWLEALADTLSWRVERFDLDPRAESAFSWRAVGNLFATAASTKCLRLPCACVEGRAVLRFDGESGLCVSHRERVDAVDLAATSRLRNRRVAADVAEYLDVRRPAQVAEDVWAVEVASAVLVGVPGAGPLDIEPLADTTEGVAALGAFAFVAACALAVSVRTLGDETGVFGATLCDEVGESAWAYTQCVADVFG